MSQSPSLQDFVAKTLRAMGLPDPGPLMHVLALREGRLVAEKFHYDEGYAVWLVGSNVVEFYDQQGELVKSLGIALADKEEAA